MIDLKLTQILDVYIRGALTTIRDTITRTGLSGANMRHMEIETRGAVSGAPYPHKLGFTPKDIIITYQSGAVTWNYDKFTKDDLNLTTSGPVKIRFLVGKIG